VILSRAISLPTIEEDALDEVHEINVTPFIDVMSDLPRN
jgi:biopolymer transport protein ExbD